MDEPERIDEPSEAEVNERLLLEWPHLRKPGSQPKGTPAEQLLAAVDEFRERLKSIVAREKYESTLGGGLWS